MNILLEMDSTWIYFARDGFNLDICLDSTWIYVW